MKSILLGLIRGYQRFLSPLLGAHCRFEPSCSRYTAEAIEVHGSLKGTLLGAWRILRCNPFTRGGQIDPVPRPGRWRAPDSLEPETKADPPQEPEACRDRVQDDD